MKKTYFKKTTYTSPEVELLVVRGGEAILGASDYHDGGAGDYSGDINANDNY